MFSTLAPYILRLRCLVVSNTYKKTAGFDFFGNVVFVVLEVYNRFDGFRTNLFEKLKGWPVPPKPRHKISKISLSLSKNITLSSARLVSLLWEVREIVLREVLPVLVVILVVVSVFLFQQRQCPTELEKWPWSVCLKFFGQKNLRNDSFK